MITKSNPIPPQWNNVLTVAKEVLADMPQNMIRSRDSMRFIIATCEAEIARRSCSTQLSAGSPELCPKCQESAPASARHRGETRWPTEAELTEEAIALERARGSVKDAK